jgi:hypothetical protein
MPLKRSDSLRYQVGFGTMADAIIHQNEEKKKKPEPIMEYHKEEFEALSCIGRVIRQPNVFPPPKQQ